MTTEKKAQTRRPRSLKPAPAAEACATYDGSGETTTTVRVGRKRREIGATQSGLCPTCLGIGSA
ncbi:hypothetical protein [Streptomyces sp. WM6368]|uniref:hypothetical protein n=1 Tax=Streptomyces sp. WM6368 TaxID=1415554 RepID=UPI0006AD8645|nr:hypothetical protein [Streptomyces sp. WM6368]KOU37390.1 hypothetical protein ADK51_02350 [Streptomyces sp. WM6368]